MIDTSTYAPLDGCLLITGGTGSFGHAVLRSFLDSSVQEIRIFSRDEKKQDDMRKRFAHPKLKFYLGDVRDAASVMNAMRGVNYVFHAAALKQVPSCEFFPLQAVQTNVLGTQNVLQSAIDCGVQRVVCLSTDKAVYPINAMGISKAMMEKISLAQARNGGATTICVTRYGNVMASRGSVIPLFLQQVRMGLPMTLTDPGMTRFMMTLDDAVDLVLYAFTHGRSGDTFVQKAPAATVATVAQALARLAGQADYPRRIIGTRHGEKKAEVLLSREEFSVADDLGRYFRVPMDGRDLNYGRFLEEGQTQITQAQEYTSDNTEQLDVDGLIALLGKVRAVQAWLKGEEPQEEG